MNHTNEVNAVLGEPARDMLIERIGKAPSRKWIDLYFDLMASLIEATKLRNGDPRFVTSIPGKTYSIPMHLPVTINGRYVLSPDVGYTRSSAQTAVDLESLARSGDDYLVSVIYGPEFEALPRDVKLSEVAYHTSFEPRPYESPPAPFWVTVKHPERLLIHGVLRDGWISAALSQVETQKASPNRRYHEPLVYRVATDRGLRETFLDMAFPDA